MTAEKPGGASVAAFQSERQFSDAVVEYARLCGWKVHRDPTWRATGADAGYPDLTLARKGQIIFAELKTAKGRMSAAQEDWLDELRGLGVRVRLWRPNDWPEIERVLR